MKATGILKSFCMCAVLIVPMLAQAEPGDARTEKMNRMCAEMGLTEEQNAKLSEMHKEIHAVRTKSFESIRAVRAKISEELKKENPSSTQLDAYAAELGNLHKEMVQHHNNHLLKVKTVLTADQFAKLVSKEEKGFGMHFDKKGKKGAHQGAQCNKPCAGEKKCNKNEAAKTGCGKHVE